jgi:arylsulfatase A-like enzyme
MGFLGSTRGLTPALDALARTSTVFTRAYSQAPITTVSHATILSGTYPPFHHVSDFGSPLPATVPYLPDLLRRSGYRTAAFVGALVLDPRTGTAPGFDRGFDLYDAGFRLRRPGEDRYQTLERRGDEVGARAMRWMAQGGSTPWFAWVHLYDAHDPYDPPADLKGRFSAAPYDGEIAAIDRTAGRLAQSAGPGAIVAVTADHGESLGDHGEDTHGVFLYDAVLHVPLVIRLPNGRGAGASDPSGHAEERIRQSCCPGGPACGGTSSERIHTFFDAFPFRTNDPGPGCYADHSRSGGLRYSFLSSGNSANSVVFAREKGSSAGDSFDRGSASRKCRRVRTGEW